MQYPVVMDAASVQVGDVISVTAQDKGHVTITRRGRVGAIEEHGGKVFYQTPTGGFLFWRLVGNPGHRVTLWERPAAQQEMLDMFSDTRERIS